MNRTRYKIICGTLLLAGVIGSTWLVLNGNRSQFRVGGGIEENGKNGCKVCHEIQPSAHDLHAVFDCNACHLGNGKATEAELAHQGMVLIPGNLADATQTCGVCHEQEVSDVHHSLMTSNVGIVAVDRFVFGEQDTPDGTTAITEIGHSVADDHLRNLCSSCHLGNEKMEFGVIDDASRGGGCNACHLNYEKKAVGQLNAYLDDPKNLPTTHPTLDLKMGDQHCLGCHSRSGRISMNYQGFHETQLEAIPGDGGRYQKLQDGRIFEYVKEDVHHQQGLSCIDCHSYADAMGDGKTYAHEEHAVKVRCEDCHMSVVPDGVAVGELPDIYQRIYRSRNYSHEKMLVTADGGIPLVNTYLPGDGKAYLFGKMDGNLHPMKAPSEGCSREFAHSGLSCSSCHTDWAPQCIECHTEYDANREGYDLLANQERMGAWLETAGDFRAEAPALGVYERVGSKGATVQPAVPGMIMTLNKEAFLKDRGEKQSEGEQFHRLFAPASPHTTTREGRDCRSCHNNPVALGYGKGKMVYTKDGSESKWIFEPNGPISQIDGLPADAWIPFLGERKGVAVSTRKEFRPFTLKEQRRILTVGACLECHGQQSEMMRMTLNQDFDALLKRLPKECRIPEW